MTDVYIAQMMLAGAIAWGLVLLAGQTTYGVYLWWARRRHKP